jgi:hypothetical protein
MKASSTLNNIVDNASSTPKLNKSTIVGLFSIKILEIAIRNNPNMLVIENENTMPRKKYALMEFTSRVAKHIDPFFSKPSWMPIPPKKTKKIYRLRTNEYTPKLSTLTSFE